MTSCLDPPDTGLADVGTAAAEQVGIAEAKKTNGTSEGFRKRVDEFALVSSGGEWNTLISGRKIRGFSHDRLALRPCK